MDIHKPVMIARTAQSEAIWRVAKLLKDILGALLTAYLSGRDNAEVVDIWISKQQVPSTVEEQRLRYGYWAAALVEDKFDAETAKSLFLGTAELLSDHSPASWLRDHEEKGNLKLVVDNAKNFLYR
jgi:hypothetical protein